MADAMLHQAAKSESGTSTDAGPSKASSLIIKDWEGTGVDMDDSGGTSEGGNRARGRSRRELPPHAVSILKAWLVSPEHFHHPYPTAQDQAQLMAETGIDKKQLKNWFTNARRRIWKPLVKHKLQATEGMDDDGHDGVERQDSSHSMASRRSTTSSFLDLLATAVDGDSTNSFSMQQSPGGRRHQRGGDDDRNANVNGAANDGRGHSAAGGPVAVSPNTTCAFCLRDRVDTQLMPCKHVFHGCCLRPWLEATVTTPCCPVCSVAISNCVLADAKPDLNHARPNLPPQHANAQVVGVNG